MNEPFFIDMASKPKHKLGWLAITPTPYFEDLFLLMALGEVFATRAYFISRLQPEPPSTHSQRFNINYLDNIKDISRLLLLIMFSADRKWIIGGWNQPIYAIALTLLAVLGKKYWIFTDAPIPEGRSPYRIVRAIRKHLLRFWMKNAKGVFGTGSLGVKKLLELGSPEAKTINLPYPLDEARFNIADLGLTGHIEICCSGRLVIQDKRYDLAIIAFSECVRKFPDCSIGLTIAGSGKDEWMLRKIAADLAISDRVQFVGWQSQTGLRDIYNRSQIYLHPTDFEPYGVTVVEALYSGLYVIASDQVGSAVELIMPNVNGSLFPAGRLDLLVATLNDVVAKFRFQPPSKQTVRTSSLKWEMSKYLEYLDKQLSA